MNNEYLVCDILFKVSIVTILFLMMMELLV